jgi:hypothetical protein
MSPAEDARQLVHDLGADDAVAKVVGDAPPLTDAQREILRGILMSGHDDGVGLDTDPISDQGLPRRGLRAS